MNPNATNTRASFRMGDWICPASGCGEHNFGRNALCRTCASPRPFFASPGFVTDTPYSHATSPRFQNLASAGSIPQLLSGISSLSLGATNSASTPTPSAIGTAGPFFQTASGHTYAQTGPSIPSVDHLPPPRYHSLPQPAQPPVLLHRYATDPSHRHSQLQPSSAVQQHVLTPSGRSFSQGGRVQNVSSDPLAPCIMFWPDNEPLPEPGQVRPSAVLGILHPPILNTGNRGPIEHQPGDWVCKKCSYLNWRRRKVCQTCYPYAEGNNDSISAAVQASRIAILKQLLEAQADSARVYTPSLSHTANPEPSRRHTHAGAGRHHTLTPDYPSGLEPRDSAPIYQTTPRNEAFHRILQYQTQRPPAVSSDPYRPSKTPPPPFHSASCTDDRLHFDRPIYAQAKPRGDALQCTADVLTAPTPATTLLPSFFLNELIQSPSLSPASSAASEVELEHFDSPATSCASLGGHALHSPKVASIRVPVVRSSPRSNIWRINATENHVLGPIGSGRKNSWDM